MEIFNPHSNIDFLRWRKVSITISAVLVILSVTMILTRGLNYALDFTGGVVVEVGYDRPIEIGVGPNRAGSSSAGSAIALTGNGSASTSRR